MICGGTPCLIASRDGVDILIGKGRKDAITSFAAPDYGRTGFAGAGYRFGEDPALVREAGRAVVPRDQDFETLPAVKATISRSSNGYFLMVYCDMPTSKVERGCATLSRWTT